MADVLALAEAGMRSSIAKLDVISHNMANANTQAFKRELFLHPGFEHYLQPTQPGAQLPPPIVERRDWSAGPLTRTGAPLNFALEGEGWFQLRSPQGVVLTRNGDFQLDAQGHLVSQQGWPVMMDADASLAGGIPSLSGNNELSIGGTRVAQFLLVKAPAGALQTAGAGTYRVSDGTALEPASGVLRQGFLEGSNVDSLGEMVGLVEAMREAEASQRVIRAYDEALESAISALGEF